MASEDNGLLDAKIPQWKRELILRRRAVGRPVECVSCSSVDGAMRLPDSDGLAPDIKQLMNKTVRSKMGEEKKKFNGSVKLKGKMLDEECGSDSSEELQYGPGIVSKLKIKYLSLTLRECQPKSRPSLAVFRRAASLENLLDEESSPVEVKPTFVKNITNGTSTTRYRGMARGNDNMKRARSVEALMRYEKAKQETEPERIKPVLEETELPPPDVVKQTLKIFEKQSPTKTINKGQNPPSAKKPVLSPKPTVIQDKSEIKQSPKKEIPKEVIKQEPENNNVINPDVIKNGVTTPETIILRKREAPIPPFRTRPRSFNTEPKARSRDFKKSASMDKMITSPIENSPILKSLRLSIEKDIHQEPEKTKEKEIIKTEDVVDDCKQIKETEMNIRKQTSMDEKNIKSYLPSKKLPRPSSMDLTEIKKELPMSPTSRPISPVLLKAPSAILAKEINMTTSPMKQIGVIRPMVTNKQMHSSQSFPINKYTISKHSTLTDRELEKNLINTVKSIEQPVTKVIVSIKKSAEECLINSEKIELEKKNANTWDKKSNTMVFNFSDRKTVPDYIENDGLILTTKKEKPKPGDSGIIILSGGTDESSTTDFDTEDVSLDYSNPPSPCNVLFEGDNVLINGKSNLRKEPKQRKLRIQFNDQATTLFEYPSEASLLDETSTTAGGPGLHIPLGGSSSLASYTPSKVSLDNEFQLGVTRATVVTAKLASPQTTVEVDEDYLKPADDKDTVTWSSGSMDDLLF